MLKINLSFEKPRISINGIVYDVLRSDAQIVQDMLDIDKEFESQNMEDPACVLKKNRAMISYLDKLLGKGAASQIAANVPGLNGAGLGLGGISGILSAIVQTAGKAYSDSFNLKYGDDE